MLLIVIWLVISMGESIELVLEVDCAKAQNHSTALCLPVMLVCLVLHTPPSRRGSRRRRLDCMVVACIVAYCLYHIKSTNTIRVKVVVGCLISRDGTPGLVLSKHDARELETSIMFTISSY
jgi:hypothetical protein